MVEDLEDRVYRTIRMQTEGPQSRSVALSSLRVTLVEHNNHDLDSVNGALDRLESEDKIEIADGQVRLSN